MKKESDEKQPTNSKRQRSPNYPSISLDEAISRLKTIYDNDRRSFTTAEAVVSHLGYNTSDARSGTSGRIIASLKHYGLLDEKDGQFRVSDDGYKILHLPEDSAERKELIQRTALSPTAFEKTFNYYQGELPSDTTLRSHLILHENFNPDRVNSFIRVLRKTIEFADLSFSQKEDAKEIEVMNNEQEFVDKQPVSSTPISNQVNNQNSQSPFAIPYDGEALKFRISRDSEVIVSFSGRVTQESIEKLKVLLEATKDTYPTQEELEQSRSAIWKNKDPDQPVKVMSKLGQGSDGKNYVKIEGSETGVPVDELDFGEN